MHKYRVFDVGVDGSLSDTGRVLEFEPIQDEYYRDQFANRNDIVKALFAYYGFTQYVESYNPVASTKNPGDIEITYSYPSGGRKPTWYLKKGE